MAVIKAKRKSNHFVILDKTCLSDSRLSLKAMGLHAYLMSQSEDWVIHVKELTRHFKDGRDSILSAMKELIAKGYVLRQQERNEKGAYVGISYHVYESPTLKEEDELKLEAPINREIEPEKDFPVLDNSAEDIPEILAPCPTPEDPETENPATEKPTLINIKDNKYKSKQILAAAEEGGKSETSKSAHAAADFFSVEKQIEKKLTVNQWQVVKEEAVELSRLVKLNAEALAKQMASALVDESQFVKTGRDFHYKLNAIKKTIRQGQWQTVRILNTSHKTEIEPTDEQKRDTLINALRQELVSRQAAEKSNFERAEKYRMTGNPESAYHYDLVAKFNMSECYQLKKKLAALMAEPSVSANAANKMKLIR